MEAIFQQSTNLSAHRSGVGAQDLYHLLASDPNVEWSCKAMCEHFSLELTEENIKDMSNRAGYLLSKGHAERVRPGTYRVAQQKGNTLTDTDTAQAVNGEAQYPSVPADFACDKCDFVGKSQMGLKAHITRNHGPGLTANQAFERIGQACEILFPDGLPMARVIEIAELQKSMLKVITR